MADAPLEMLAKSLQTVDFPKALKFATRPASAGSERAKTLSLAVNGSDPRNAVCAAGQ